MLIWDAKSRSWYRMVRDDIEMRCRDKMLWWDAEKEKKNGTVWLLWIEVTYKWFVLCVCFCCIILRHVHVFRWMMSVCVHVYCVCMFDLCTVWCVWSVYWLLCVTVCVIYVLCVWSVYCVLDLCILCVWSVYCVCDLCTMCVICVLCIRSVYCVCDLCTVCVCDLCTVY